VNGVALCIPVLNDAAGLADVLPRLERTLAEVPHTVCVVDDGSTDGTLEWLATWTRDHPSCVLLARQKVGRGCVRGAATRDGLRWLLQHTTHGVFVDLDADGAQPPEEIPPALAHLAAHPDCAVVVASKYVRGSTVVGRPFARRVGSRAYNALLRAALGWSLRDYSNSFRIYRRSSAELVAAADTRHDTPAFLVEMVAVWRAAGVRIDERPTHYVERSTGGSKVDWSDALVGIAAAWDVIMGARRGRYHSGLKRT
jgi:dolichol-phosphate mannosyltransferase